MSFEIQNNIGTNPKRFCAEGKQSFEASPALSAITDRFRFRNTIKEPKPITNHSLFRKPLTKTTKIHE
jgi:hypothetical protein